MKRGILLILTALMLSLLSVQALGAAQLTALPHLEITLINQEPEPAAPGSFVELKFMIENLGGDSAQEVELQLVENYPFTVYEDSNIKFLGTIQGRQMDDEGQIVKFRVRIDDNAIDGEHVVQLKYRHKSSNGKTSWIKTDDIAIDIRAEKPFLSIDQVLSNKLIPGKTTPVLFVLKNDASSDFKNIEITLDDDSTIFRPVGSSNTKRISRIIATETHEISFDIATTFDTPSGVTSLRVTLTFSDDAGNEYTREEIIGLEVFDVPSYITAIEDTDVYSKGTTGKVVVSLSNIGQSELKFVSATILESDDYEIIGARSEYLGNVESDDFETGEFSIYPYTGKDFNLTVELFYKDVYNNEYTDVVNLPIKIYSSSELKEFGLITSGSSLGKVIFILILLALIYYGYRRWEKKKKK